MSKQPPYRVLVAPPPDPASARVVVACAARLADHFRAEVLLLGIAPVALPGAGGEGLATTGPGRDRVQDQQARLDADARGRMESLAAGVPGHVPVLSLLARGRPGPAIVLAAREHEADLVVVGMRRAGRVGHALHDGADRYVLQHSAVPVLVVPQDVVHHNRAVVEAA